VGGKANETRFAWLSASRRSLARLAADSVLRHVLEPARAAGETAIGVYIHSWNPELSELLTQLYAPLASEHEAASPRARALASQHLSMKRCLALVPGGTRLVMVARLDLLFFADVPLRALVEAARSRHALWLPEACQDDHAVPRAERAAVFASCGCGTGPHDRCDGISGKGRLVEAPSAERVSARGPAEEVHSLFVLDWWFIATPSVARRFAAIHDNYTHYVRALRRRHFAGPAWAHFYWAHHVTHELPASVAVHFVALQHGRDFTLARFVRFGVDCEAPVLRPETLAGTASFTAAKLARLSVHPRLEGQCPLRLQRHQFMLCPWNTPACPLAHAKRVVAALRRAEHALRLEGLPFAHAFDRFQEPRPIRQALRNETFASAGIELRIPQQVPAARESEESRYVSPF
jgi:hypothetical protein